MGKHCKQTKSSVQCLFILLSFIYVVNAISEDELDDLLDEHEAVLHLFGIGGICDDEVQVTYSNDFKLTPGTKTSPSQVASAPKVTWTADPSDNYTLILIDVNAYLKNSRESGESDRLLYWLVTDITGSDVKNGKVLESYKPPQLSTNPRSDKTHDFVFVLYSHKPNKYVKSYKRQRQEKNLLKYFSEEFLHRDGSYRVFDSGESVLSGPVGWNWFILEEAQ